MTPGISTPTSKTSCGEPKAPESVEVVEAGPVRAIVRVVRNTDKSTITQDITMYAHSPRVDFATHVGLARKARPVQGRPSP